MKQKGSMNYAEAKQKLGIDEEEDFEIEEEEGDEDDMSGNNRNGNGNNSGGGSNLLFYLIVAGFIYFGLLHLGIWGVLMNQIGNSNASAEQISVDVQQQNSNISDMSKLLSGLVDSFSKLADNQQVLSQNDQALSQRIDVLERGVSEQGNILTKILDLLQSKSAAPAALDQQYSAPQSGGVVAVPTIFYVPTATVEAPSVFK